MSEVKEIKRPRIDDEAFARAWARAAAAGGTVADVAVELGCTVSGVLNKSKRLERDGVKFPPLKKSGRGVTDVAGLNALIASIMG